MPNLQPVGFNGWMGQMGPGESGTCGRFILDSTRFKRLDRKQQFFDGTQHDHKGYDFDGHIVNMETGGVVQAAQPLLTGEKDPHYIPLRNRRPSASYRLGRAMVNAFTGLCLGDQRFPTLQVATDSNTQDYVQTLSRCSSLPVRMIQARSNGGACGTACLSWAYVKGLPRVRVHEAKHVHVHAWEDRDEFVPRHVIECYQSEEQVWDSLKRRLVAKRFWHRRDWMLDMDIVYKPVEVRSGVEPDWEPDWGRCVEHRDKCCHFCWIQNLPSTNVDGDADYETLYDNFDTLDLIASVLCRGAILNLDPTLVLKVDPDMLMSGNVRKGSDNALIPGTDGDAKYLEIAGTSIQAGINLFNKQRESTLETGQCVLLDPDKAAAQAMSSVAQKMIYAPMLNKTGVLRSQYGSGLRRLLEPAIVVAQRAHRTIVTIMDDKGNARDVKTTPTLPPRIEKVRDKDGNDQIKLVPRDPGIGIEVEPVWGPYFPATPQDKQMLLGVMFQATGQKGFLSVQTATEEAAKLLGRDERVEVHRLQGEAADAADAANEMFAGAVGSAPSGTHKHTVPTPAGGSITSQVAPSAPPAIIAPAPPPAPTPEPEPGQPTPLPMTPTSASAIITVNEARHSLGLDPMPLPEGHLSLAAYQAKFAVPIAKSANAQLGKVGVSPAGAAPSLGGFGAPKPPSPPGTPGGSPPGQPPPGTSNAPPGGAQAPQPVTPPSPPKPPGPPGFSR